NAQQNSVLDVTHNYFIDAPSVEKWLAANASAGGGNGAGHGFFFHWGGRDDFVFHHLLQYGGPGPQTRAEFFSLSPHFFILHAWGGTTADDEETGLGDLGTHRIWFHDLSAGPILWDFSWNVDDQDLDGDNRADYRIPPIWEYVTPGGYRTATE